MIGIPPGKFNLFIKKGGTTITNGSKTDVGDGGTTGTLISNFIAYHMSVSLNWGLAAALGTILLALVLALYMLYDKIVGIDNMKLG